MPTVGAWRRARPGALAPAPVATAALLAVACGLDPSPVDPGTETGARDAPLIGGDQADGCRWSGAALLIDEASDTLCSGVLIHPRLVVYAGHCGDAFEVVRFGNGETRRAVGVAQDGDGAPRCFRHPRCGTACEPNPRFAGDPWDYGVCVLESPYRDAALVPPAMGCELGLLTARGRSAWAVGFGTDDLDMSGAKNQLEMRMGSVDDDRNQVILEPLRGGEGLCVGDSGGPSYAALDDGSWRVLGIHHATDDPCGRAIERTVAPAVPWIEDVTGFDVTPCHDDDGTWRPGEACRDFPTDPGGDHGTYPACRPGPVMGALPATCGEPYDPDGGGGADAGPGDGGVPDAGPGGGGDAGFFVPDPIGGGDKLTGACRVGVGGASPGRAGWGVLLLTALAGLRRSRRCPEPAGEGGSGSAPGSGNRTYRGARSRSRLAGSTPATRGPAG